MFGYECNDCDFAIVSSRANAQWSAGDHHARTGHTVHVID